MSFVLAPLWKKDISQLTGDALWTHFNRCLEAHDWTYYLSENVDVVDLGEQKKEHLLKVFCKARSADYDRAFALYNKHLRLNGYE